MCHHPPAKTTAPPAWVLSVAGQERRLEGQQQRPDAEPHGMYQPHRINPVRGDGFQGADSGQLEPHREQRDLMPEALALNTGK